MPETRRLLRPPTAHSNEEEDRPRHRLRREEPPTRLRRSASNDRHDDDADDDAGLAVAKGWSGYRRTKANAPTQFTKLYKVLDDEQIIMFLEDEPYANFIQHWAEWMPRGQKMSYVCLQENCPLCDVDPKPVARVRWNILDCSGDTPLLVTYECGTSITDMLNEYAKKEPLTGRYFAVQMAGSKNNRRTQIRPVKIRDLKEDWEFSALTEEQIAKFDTRLWDESSIEVDSRAELQKVADAYSE